MAALRLVVDNTAAQVVTLPARIEHSALRHAALRQARDGLILRDHERTTVNGRTAIHPVRVVIGELEAAGCIAWSGDLDSGQAGGITAAGRRQLAAWDRRSRRPSSDGGGDAA